MKLKNIEQKLIKLDQIDNHLSNLSKSVSIIDSRVSSLENSVQENSKKLTDLEASRAYDSKTCEDIRKSQIDLERKRREGEKKISKVSDDIESLKRRNEELAEEIIDLQGRERIDSPTYHWSHVSLVPRIISPTYQWSHFI